MTYILIIFAVLLTIIAGAFSFSRFGKPVHAQGKDSGEADMRQARATTLSSSMFSNGGAIPSEYTCDGRNISPPLAISHVPAKAKSLALTVEDADASGGTFDHWVVFNIPPVTSLIEQGQNPPGMHGNNSRGQREYAGPCPESETHQYVFTLYALDAPLPVSEGSAKRVVLDAMEGHVISVAQLTGLYRRRLLD